MTEKDIEKLARSLEPQRDIDGEPLPYPEADKRCERLSCRHDVTRHNQQDPGECLDCSCPAYLE